jgi:hypothetical protein
MERQSPCSAIRIIHPETNCRKEVKEVMKVEGCDFAFQFVADLGNYIVCFDDAQHFVSAGILMTGSIVIGGIGVRRTMFRHQTEHTVMMMVMRNECKRQQ